MELTTVVKPIRNSRSKQKRNPTMHEKLITNKPKHELLPDQMDANNDKQINKNDKERNPKSF